MIDVSIEGISREKFESYEQVRQSGVTNMFNVGLVCKLSELSRAEVYYIMENYDKLALTFKDVVDKENSTHPKKIGLVNLNTF